MHHAEERGRGRKREELQHREDVARTQARTDGRTNLEKLEDPNEGERTQPRANDAQMREHLAPAEVGNVPGSGEVRRKL